MSSRLALALLASAPLAPRGQETVPPELFTPQQLKQDFRIARCALEKGHPGIYRYVTKEALDRQFNEAEKKLDHPMDVYGFWAILAPAVARIECGHTHLDLPESALDALSPSAPMLPLQVKLIGRKIYIFRDYTSEDGALAGREILSINGMPIEKIVAALSRVEPEDGEIPTSRLRHVGRHFGAGLYVLLGMRTPYTVTYRAERAGRAKRVILPGLVPSRLKELSQARYPQDDPPADHSADLKFLDDGRIAVMAISGFRCPRRGVFPDYPVRRTITDWLAGRDPEMAVALALARKAGGGSVQSDPSGIQ